MMSSFARTRTRTRRYANSFTKPPQIMNISQKNRMGAGDGIAVQETPMKKRQQVPSSRKFATRGLVNDANVKQQLREALEQYVTPPESPLRRRSLSIAEITPVSRSKSNEALKRKNMLSNGRCKTPNETTLHGKAKGLLKRCDKDKRMMDAGRRVCHQLVLNAWRQRRCELAAMVESRERVQTQVDQLQIQVDVLQKLRESEAARRVDAANENHQLKLRLDDFTHKNQELANLIECMKNEQDSFKDIINQMHVEIMNERNCNQTLRTQKDYVDEGLCREKQQVTSLRNEITRLIKRVDDYETEIIEHKNICKQYEDAIRMSEDKYVEYVDKFEELLEKYDKLDRINEQLRDDKHELDELLTSCRVKNEKIEIKMHDLKKLLTTCRQIKKRTQEENDELKMEIERERNDFKMQNDRQWWLKTGEFLFSKFAFCAYLLFPAIPRIPTDEEMKQLAVLQGSIALGSL